VTMPALGIGHRGTVTRWLKNVGDSVAVDEPLLEVSTDKVDTEIPSPVAGTLQEILVAEDETVPVGTDLAIVGDGAPSSAAPPLQSQPPNRSSPRQQSRKRCPSRSRGSRGNPIRFGGPIAAAPRSRCRP